MGSAGVAPARGGRGLAVGVTARLATKAQASSSAMVCVDCGYIYDGKEAFDSLPNNYKCPVCDSSKKRFFAATGRVPRGNAPKVMRERREIVRQQVEESGASLEEDNGFLYATAGGTFALLAVFYFLATSR